MSILMYKEIDRFDIQIQKSLILGVRVAIAILDLLQIKFEQSLGSIHSCIKPQLNYTVTHNDDGDCGIVQPEF